ncbi:hypothetical protein BDP55DRAFT_685541 [Colletotrichum godetiae]|uniref:Uncharacterized protein n=1 Tax=Colletotrichum godetiae TaxID=1209918 RepID=A0AAJ0EPE9_9PEZI|nr:uncharacterized protein BDP55DRAFT_688724 [Colletotrichum godetiae]XP_060422263.1 uncharacterized protein BDP55DRAFT_685541 [Colletotrichum godetiae]KAK1656539.1 hypothetical protein BDP55DRAFT_688724 [Colletotrichum godetiae]KAK1657499.1 hypothetical protein BDP55DRAFT_685541 [Colletotrichum godetiae]
MPPVGSKYAPPSYSLLTCGRYTCQGSNLNNSTTNGCGCSQSVAQPQKATFDEIDRGFLRFSRLDLSDARELTAGPALLVTGPELEQDRASYTRNNPLYLETRMRSDGLYVCPWNGRPDCSHLATSSFEASRSYIDDHLTEDQIPRA